MTFAEILIGNVIGFTIVAVSYFADLSPALGTLGLIVVILSYVVGGADGTLPRMR